MSDHSAIVADLGMVERSQTAGRESEPASLAAPSNVADNADTFTRR
jgi:hypothetical protein